MGRTACPMCYGNAFAESFNSIFRRECLNENWFLDMADARTAVESWRNKYNDRRPHGWLEKSPPRSIHDVTDSPSSWRNDGGQTRSFAKSSPSPRAFDTQLVVL